ncbi:spermatogenesis-associated protein 46 isoform X2 [Delphinapterus leucas]|uniref:Spermatogenesis-associated protein 46 isoform X2 n=1 Tax=Delphinapterus leucas TaxID=9749 RepID=A0A2Y9MQD2_DELLE|nr:spermatogenesis-associated protein 46 isoform X2 [Delphinapterus leucas]
MSAELRMFIVWTTQPASWKQACVTSIHFSSQNMENFSLLSISGPRIASSALSTFPDITSSRATSLPGCILGDPPNREKLRRNCTIYRPWFSPYSYFVCKDRESHLETYSFPEVQQDEGRGDSCLPEDTAESICSSSSSPENTCPQEATKKSRHGLDSTDYITSQDILMASKWYPAQQNGYKCAACCRMYPTLHSLKSHIKGGYKEGFSCKVYYLKLKTLWGKEQKGRPGDRLSSGSCQAFK